MSEVERMVARIHNEHAKFRATGAEPTHFILSMEARQALRMEAHPFADPLPDSIPDLLTYFGVPIIDLEGVIMVGKMEEYDPQYMLRQIERLTWEGHVLRRALIVRGADMDKIDTGNGAWMAEKKRRTS